MKYTTDPATLALREFSDSTRFRIFTDQIQAMSHPPRCGYHIITISIFEAHMRELLGYDI
jgi:hypothetical protein